MITPRGDVHCAASRDVRISGFVLPIGGLKEKVLGAHRAGIKNDHHPEGNEADIEDVPEEVRKTLEFYPGGDAQ